jgi:hypothetical protein
MILLRAYPNRGYNAPISRFNGLSKMAYWDRLLIR